MIDRDANHRECALIIIADGFDEQEVITFLSLMRRAGLCVKSVSLTSGPTGSAHGVEIIPDLIFSDLAEFLNAAPASMVILPEWEKNLTRLENDPRVHRLLRQVVAQKGQVATGPQGLRIVRAAEVWNDEQIKTVLVRQPGQSLEAFTLSLIRQLKRAYSQMTR
ncbi:MAG: DJ-1/PfpI family protein [Anaerolineae bacterium]|nr:DJ-1/PfpI family protein [Anaerolineae bacterium]